MAINEQLRVKVTATSTSTQADLVQQQMSPSALANQRKSLLRNQPFPLGVRSTTPNTSGDRQQSPSSHSNNRTPPVPIGSTLPSPGSLSAASCPAAHGGKDGSSRTTSSAVESSIYCYLCGLNSTRSFAHWLPSTPSASEPAAPYFPYVLHLKASSRAERLREDGAALVCTFCYHMVSNNTAIIRYNLIVLLVLSFYSRYMRSGSSTRTRPPVRRFSRTPGYTTRTTTRATCAVSLPTVNAYVLCP